MQEPTNRNRPVLKRTVTVNLGMWLVELVLRTASGGFRWLVFLKTRWRTADSTKARPTRPAANPRLSPRNQR